VERDERPRWRRMASGRSEHKWAGSDKGGRERGREAEGEEW
jgi:hypothetical protein